jgi:hypothetical protein
MRVGLEASLRIVVILCALCPARLHHMRAPVRRRVELSYVISLRARLGSSSDPFSEATQEMLDLSQVKVLESCLLPELLSRELHLPLLSGPRSHGIPLDLVENGSLSQDVSRDGPRLCPQGHARAIPPVEYVCRRHGERLAQSRGDELQP